jgi:nicotinamidase-related amidase
MPAILVAAFLAIAPASAGAQRILDEWATLSPPPPPQLQDVAVEPSTTALLMLDFQKQNCGRRPRCLDTVADARHLLEQARARGVRVIHAMVPTGTQADILPELAPRAEEQTLRGGPNKFLGTDLEAILARHGIGTVIVLGTAANGAVLNTAAHAALLGLSVVLPVDGISADTAYAEQYTIHHMLSAPGMRAQTKPTSTRRIRF